MTRAMTGEAVNIEATRDQLDSISRLASQMFGAIENMDGSLAQAQLDPQTLSDIAALAEAAEGTKLAAEKAKAGINARHSQMEEAVASTGHVAKTDWYRDASRPQPAAVTTSSALAEVEWRLDTYAGHWLPIDDLTAVNEWMRENHLRRATAEQPVTVEGGMITYGQDRSPGHVRAVDREIVTVTAPLRTAPPKVWQPTCSVEDLAALNEVFAQHEWSSGFDGVCVDCSGIQVDEQGRILCRREDACPWPCPPVAEALRKAGMLSDPAADQALPRRVLGDCLDPVENARAFPR